MGGSQGLAFNEVTYTCARRARHARSERCARAARHAHGGRRGSALNTGEGACVAGDAGADEDDDISPTMAPRALKGAPGTTVTPVTDDDSYLVGVPPYGTDRGHYYYLSQHSV